MTLPLEESSGEGVEEIIKGEISEFLHEFESSEETEDDMKSVLSLWSDSLYLHAREVGGRTQTVIKAFLNVCEDYANNRGMLERVKREAEEIRIFLDL
jgi:hypothetical protein